MNKHNRPARSSDPEENTLRNADSTADIAAHETLSEIANIQQIDRTSTSLITLAGATSTSRSTLRCASQAPTQCSTSVGSITRPTATVRQRQCHYREPMALTPPVPSCGIRTASLVSTLTAVSLQLQAPMLHFGNTCDPATGLCNPCDLCFWSSFSFLLPPCWWT